MHDGKVGVFSAGEGKGCSFTVSISMKRKAPGPHTPKRIREFSVRKRSSSFCIGEKMGDKGDDKEGDIEGDKEVSVRKKSFDSANRALIRGQSMKFILKGQSSKSNFAFGRSLQGDESFIYNINNRYLVFTQYFEP